MNIWLFIFIMTIFIEVSLHWIWSWYQEKNQNLQQPNFLYILIVIRFFFLNGTFNIHTTKMNVSSFSEDYFNYIWLHLDSFNKNRINNLNKNASYWFKKSFLLLSRHQFKTWHETHSNYVIINIMFCRQHSWNWNPEKWIQPQAARVVFPPGGDRRQQLPCPEQHKHSDYSRLQMWLWWNHPVL